MRQVAELIQRRLGLTGDDGAIQFVLTVPAVWSDKAKDATLRAAIKAGAPAQGISLVSEPEAAALYTLRAIQPCLIARNDVFIVCDAGGGTVDLISYMVKELDPLRVMEATKGTGRICGSMLLDTRFEELLRDKMGAENYDALPTKSKEAALLHWRDRVKPLFAGKFDEDDFSDVPTYIPIPGAKDDPEVPIEDGFFELTIDEIAAIFDPIVRDVGELVDEQMEALAKVGFVSPTILLVGGFGASEYLFRRLQEARPCIKVLQLPNSWSAVLSGAVLHGLESHSVESRIARRNYGVTFRPQWDLERHAEEDKQWSALEEKHFSRHLECQWYIRKVLSHHGILPLNRPANREQHSKIAESEPIRMDFYRAVRVSKRPDLTFRQFLYFCNDDEAPSMDNERVIKSCQLEADLHDIPRELFQKKTNSKGDEYWEIPFTLTMTPCSACLLFELEFNGVSYGSVTTKY
ncbi:hypothetical protein ASPCAL10479 [Aspergillus calidoustus]|uniref:Hsp70 family chaperone n=1 Tax=Aspergillus calidoustus TaxID=454130 RepID=A0A0U5G818_ASPCI|nr:hypothetical protein ASPCAL10479 [Aspergillus calidoustus]